MPIYIFLDTRDNKIYEIVQKMDEEHIAFAEDGYKLDRIFTKPQASFDTQINEFSQKEFVEKTKGKKGMTIGEATDISAELSEKRAKISGQDPIKQKVIDSYQKKTGKKHPSLTKGGIIEI